MADFNLSNLTVKRPLRVTTYTTGSGTFTPLVSNGIARVTVVGGGGAGGGVAGGTSDRFGAGGAGGETISLWMRLSEASYSYSVGAAGTGGAGDGPAGGTSYFGHIYAAGGWGGRSFGGGGETYGSEGGSYNTIDDAGAIAALSTVSQFSVSGGGGGRGDNATYGNGKAAGCPNMYSSGTMTYWPDSGVGGLNVGGGGGGSLYGKGGDGTATGAGANATGYGAGGGGGGNNGNTNAYNGGSGTGGLIIIEEWGVP